MKRKSSAEVGLKGIPAQKFVRGFDHVDGNWPSHVYLAGKYSGLRDITSICLGHYKASCGQSEPPVVPIDAPHLSLSKPFVLRFHQINPFLRTLSDFVRHIETFAVVVASKYRTLVNEHETRRFVALHVEDNRGQILKLIEKVSEALRLFQQPSYYENPIFHISVASMLMKSTKQVTVQQTQDSDGQDADQTSSSVGDIVVVTAQMVHSLPLTALTSQTEDELDKGESDTSDEDSAVPDWQRSMVIKQSTGGSNKPAIPSVVATITAPVDNDAKGGLFGLIDDYGSDNDEVSAQPSTVPSSTANKSDIISKSTDDAEQPALTKVLTFTAVECKIGNRLYRLDLQRSLSSITGADMHNYSFYEVK